MKPDTELTTRVQFTACLCVGAVLGLLVLPSCTVANGNGTAWSYKSVGGDFTGTLTPAGINGTVNNSTAFGKATDTIKGMWTNYLMAEGLKYLSGKYYDAKGAEVSSAETVKLQELKNAKSVADAEASLKVLEANHAAEAAAAATAVPVAP